MGPDIVRKLEELGIRDSKVPLYEAIKSLPKNRHVRIFYGLRYRDQTERRHLLEKFLCYLMVIQAIVDDLKQPMPQIHITTLERMFIYLQRDVVPPGYGKHELANLQTQLSSILNMQPLFSYQQPFHYHKVNGIVYKTTTEHFDFSTSMEKKLTHLFGKLEKKIQKHYHQTYLQFCDDEYLFNETDGLLKQEINDLKTGALARYNDLDAETLETLGQDLVLAAMIFLKRALKLELKLFPYTREYIAQKFFILFHPSFRGLGLYYFRNILVYCIAELYALHASEGIMLYGDEPSMLLRKYDHSHQAPWDIYDPHKQTRGFHKIFTFAEFTPPSSSQWTANQSSTDFEISTTPPSSPTERNALLEYARIFQAYKTFFEQPNLTPEVISYYTQFFARNMYTRTTSQPIPIPQQNISSTATGHTIIHTPRQQSHSESIPMHSPQSSPKSSPQSTPPASPSRGHHSRTTTQTTQQTTPATLHISPDKAQDAQKEPSPEKGNDMSTVFF